MSNQHRIEYGLLSGVAFLFRWLPLGTSRALGRGVGMFAWVLGIRKQVALENICRAFPELSVSEAADIYRKSWLHFGMVAAEMSRLPRMRLADFKNLIDYKTLDALETIYSRGKGGIFVSGHIGNWEWLGAMTAARGYPFSFIVATQTNLLVDSWMDRMRARENVEIINRASAPKKTLIALKANKLVAILCDQDAGSAGIFVPFFGKLASTPRGPAVFHLKTGAPILYGSCCRENGRFNLRFEEIKIDDIDLDLEEKEYAIMARITQCLENDVRSHPDQYMWLHRRWKSSPKDPATREEVPD